MRLSGRVARTITVVAVLSILGAACGATSTPTSPAGGSSASGSATAAASRTPAPTPAPPPTPLTVQSAVTITDTDQYDLGGSTAPGAAVLVHGSTAASAESQLTTTADAQGHFSVHLTGLPEGATAYLVDATASGFSTTTAGVTITRTVSPAAYKASAASIPYNQLNKDPDALKGRIVTYSAQVFQYDTGTGKSNMIVSVTDDGYGYCSDNMWLDVDPAMTGPVCKGTIIRFWGAVVGAYTYETTNNGHLTIPEVNVRYIDVTDKGC